MKILCTGNPSGTGIAQSLQNLYPDATFISRANGHDLTTKDGIDRFKNLLPDYDVFINHSQLVGDLQRQLLKHARQIWSKGHVINIGSILEFPKWQFIDPDGAEEKRQLRELSLELNTEFFKTTHLILGGLQSCNGDPLRIHTDRVAETIQWVLDNANHIPLIYLDKVSDELVSRYLK
jgi:hypothetical protein